MSNKELKRHYVIKQCVEGILTSSQAAQCLCLSTRRIKQLKKEFKEKGAVAVIHGNARRPSPKRLDQENRIEQDKFPAKTAVTVLLSEKHGLRALINGNFYPISSLNNITKKRGRPCQNRRLSSCGTTTYFQLLAEKCKSGLGRTG